MKIFALAPLGALGLLAASPQPSPTPAPTVTIVCASTPFYLWGRFDGVPQRDASPRASQGQRFDLISTRSTLQGDVFVETNVPSAEPGRAGEHLWVLRTCTTSA